MMMYRNFDVDKEEESNGEIYVKIKSDILRERIYLYD